MGHGDVLSGAAAHTRAFGNAYSIPQRNNAATEATREEEASPKERVPIEVYIKRCLKRDFYALEGPNYHRHSIWAQRIKYVIIVRRCISRTSRRFVVAADALK